MSKKLNKFGFSWSWKRALGLSNLRGSVARKLGVPTTRSGLERKLGHFIVELLLSQLTKEANNEANEQKNKK